MWTTCTLIYLIHKPQILGQFSCWLFLFLEFDFFVIYKLGKSYSTIYSLSWLLNFDEKLVVQARPNYRCTILSFITNVITKNIYFYIWIGESPTHFTTKLKKKLILKALPFTFHKWQLYKLEEVLQKCFQLADIELVS